MSTSDINRNMLKTSLIYLFISLFVMAFGAIYERFSHGVYSNFMIYAFIFPLACGCLPFLLLGFFDCNKKLLTALSRNLYHSGIATLTVGSIIRGVLDIYGTTNYLSDYYWIVGGILLLGGIIFWFHPIQFLSKTGG